MQRFLGIFLLVILTHALGASGWDVWTFTHDFPFDAELEVELLTGEGEGEAQPTGKNFQPSNDFSGGFDGPDLPDAPDFTPALQPELQSEFFLLQLHHPKITAAAHRSLQARRTSARPPLYVLHCAFKGFLPLS